MKKNAARNELASEVLLLIAGCLIYAASTALIKDVDVIPGSFLGIAAALNKALGFPVGMVNLLLNIPVMLLVTRKLGPKVLLYTVIIMCSTSVLIDLFSARLPEMSGLNVYLLSLAGGLSMGLGAGLLILAKGTMAGTTALTLLIQQRVKKLSFGTILFMIDSLIIVLGVIIVKDLKAVIYSLLYAFSCAKMMDVVIYFGRSCGLEPAESRT